MGQQQSGELIEWDDDRGFGFIRPDGDRQRLFVHITAIRRIATRPRPGDRVRFVVGTGRNGGPAAVQVEIVGANPIDRAATRRGQPVATDNALPASTWLRLAAVAALAILLAVGSLTPSEPFHWLLLLYLGAGVVSIIVYWLDKNAAEQGRWRTAENTLHGIDLCGGIAGGLIAQVLLRHKTSKLSFAQVTAVIWFVHVVVLVGLVLMALGLVR